ncbi:DUF2207 domain-containing protein [Brooklawnia cerclae]|uniref:DUF2207 domain-containing protein n=1 Tax=Brooklawnia cerclae TaxID=349934 RepID=A0ABX0SJC8_9ACTN|nr:hypothetical protein [Brooklawnia cerclae]
MSTRHGLRKPARPRAGLVRAGLVVAAASLVGLCAFTAPAAAEDMAESYVVEGQVLADGTLNVSETITFGGDAPDSLEQRLATVKDGLEYTVLRYDISDVRVTAGGSDLGPSITSDGDYLVISVDTAQAGSDPIVIEYTVKGAAVALPEVSGQDPRTEVSWRYLQGLSVGVQDVSGTVTLPDSTRTLDIDCQAGPPAATTSCSTFASGTFEALDPEFTDGPRGTGEVVDLSFVVPSSAVVPNQILDHRWTLDRAFSTDLLPLLVALGALVVGGVALYLLHRAVGADETGAKPTIVAEFEPIAKGEERFQLVVPILPGEVGTVIDERVDPVDITATIVDLAQRGHLTIVELPRQGAHAAPDWTFERRTGADELHGYEQALLDAIAPAGGEAVTVSGIGGAVQDVVGDVQGRIYEEVVREGWFAQRPDSVRNVWGRLSGALVGATVVVLALLVAFTSFGILGLVLVGLALALLWVSQQMPRRTAQGASVLRGLEVLSINLQTQPTDHVPKDDAYAEISRILPYAIVLGGLDRWLQAMVEADNDPGVPDPDDLSWYRAPNSWHLSDLPASLDAFITMVQGKLYARR